MSKEGEVVKPKNFYALSKRQGEINVLESHPKALIIRTNFFGWGTTYRRSFSDFIVANLANNQPIDLFADVFYTPIEVTILAQRAMRLIEDDVAGILNIAGDERVSKYDFGLKIAHRFGLDSSLIRSSSIDRFPNLTSRPKDMSLDCDRVREILNLSQMTVDEQINVLFNNRNDQGREEIIKL
jgi:dTDP-4-dehydrorhamnose reductase